MALMTVNGIVLQMMCRMLSSCIGTMAVLLAIFSSVIRCGAAGVYCRRRVIALERTKSCARRRVERLMASIISLHCVHAAELVVVDHGMPAAFLITHQVPEHGCRGFLRRGGREGVGERDGVEGTEMGVGLCFLICLVMCV